jgi:hypothetical protein
MVEDVFSLLSAWVACYHAWKLVQKGIQAGGSQGIPQSHMVQQTSHKRFSGRKKTPGGQLLLHSREMGRNRVCIRFFGWWELSKVGRDWGDCVA